MIIVDDTCDKRNCHYNLKAVPEQLTHITRSDMISVFREIPSNSWLLLFSNEESEICSEVYEKDNSKLPTSFSKLLQILAYSHKCHVIGRDHTPDVSSNLL